MQKSRPDPITVKKYFAAEGSVIKWWNPEKYTFCKTQLSEILNVIDPKDKIVADIGTGNGRFAINYALRGAKKVYAVDISKEMLRLAEKEAKKRNVQEKIVFIQGDIENTKLDIKFDVVSCMEVFVHLGNPQNVMLKLAEITKDGGIVVVNSETSHIDSKFGYILYYRSLFRDLFYFSKVFRPFRYLLGRLLELPGETLYKYDPKYKFVGGFGIPKLPTAKLTIEFLKKYPEVILSPPDDVFNWMTREEFISLFNNAGLKVFKVVREGFWFFPKGYIVFARKV